MSEELVFSVTDYRGKTVIFTKKKWQEKQSNHPELHRKAFIDCLKRAIIEPDEVWEDYQDREEGKDDKRCYYKKYSVSTHAKAVVWIRGNPCKVVSAFEIDYIKENNYPNLKRLK